MSLWKKSLVVSLLLAQSAWAADTPPDYSVVPSLSWSLDQVVDPTSIGTVTGTDVAFTSLVSCEALTTDASGNFVCSAAAAGSGDITAVVAGSGLTGGATSGSATLDVGEGLAIDAAADSVAFDPTELTGSRTWGDASTDTIVWTWNRATGTDPTLTFGSNTVTGPVVAASVGFEGGTGIFGGAADYLQISSIGAVTFITEGMTTAINAEDAQIGTALSVAANDIVGTTGLINYTNFDVDAAGSVTLADGAVLDLDAINVSSTTEGLLLPQATDVSAGTAEGQASWDTDDEELTIGTGTVQVHAGRFFACSSANDSFTATFRMRLGGPGGLGSTNPPMAFWVMGATGNTETAPGAGNSWTVDVDGMNTVTTACDPVISGTSTTAVDDPCDEETTTNDSVSFRFVETGTATGTGGQGSCFEASVRD